MTEAELAHAREKWERGRRKMKAMAANAYIPATGTPIGSFAEDFPEEHNAGRPISRCQRLVDDASQDAR